MKLLLEIINTIFFLRIATHEIRSSNFSSEGW